MYYLMNKLAIAKKPSHTFRGYITLPIPTLQARLLERKKLYVAPVRTWNRTAGANLYLLQTTLSSTNGIPTGFLKNTRHSSR